jgi:glycosyltransferase involved in cell wall biosynthesis
MLTTIWRRRHDYSLAQVDVFSGPAFVWAEASCWALRRAGKPYVLTLHGGNLPVFARRWPRRVRRLLGSADAVTAPSNYLRDAMHSYAPHVELLPNPLDVAAYPFRLRTTVRPRLVWLRAFHEIYNPSLAPRVLAALAADYPDAHLTMTGPDKGDGSLERARETAERLGVADRVTFSGPVPKRDVPARLDEGDIFLNTSNVDNTPVSVLEAMACGLCVVSTNVGGIPHLLDDGRDALLVPRDDAAAAAAAIRRLLVSPLFAERLSFNSRARALGFDWSVVLPQWGELLSAVLGRANA